MAVHYLLTVHELAELLTPIHWVWSDGFTEHNQRWCALSGGFHTVWGGIDPWYHRLDSRVGGVVHVRKYFKSGGETISFPGGAGPRHCPERQLSPHAGSMSLSQSATSQMG